MKPRAWRALAWLLCFAVMPLSLAAPARTRGAEDGVADVRASVRRAQTAIGSQVIVQVRIRQAADVASIPFTLLFDPRILAFDAAATAEGDFLRKDGAATAFLAAPIVDESGGVGESGDGMAGIAVGASRLGTSGATGSGTICRLVFRARAAGSTSLAFARARVLSPGAVTLPARFTGATVEVKETRR